MRKTGLLNTAIIKEISAIGHTQYLIIGDAGLPIPKDTLLIRSSFFFRNGRSGFR